MVTTTIPPKSHKNQTSPALGRPRKDALAARDERILTVATQLFAEYGYGGFGLEMIAKEAHVALRTIYQKYGDKAALFGAMILKRRGELFAQSKDILLQTKPLDKILFDFSRSYIEALMQPNLIAIRRCIIAESNRFPEMARQFYANGPQASLTLLVDFFSRKDIRAQFKKQYSSHDLAEHFMGITLGQGTTWVMAGIAPPPEPTVLKKRIKQAIGIFLTSTLIQPPGNV